MIAVAILAWCTFFACVAPRRPHLMARSSWLFGMIVNEVPFLAVYFLIASTALAASEGDLDSTGGRVAAGCSAVVLTGLVVVAWRGVLSDRAVARALDHGLGVGWRRRVTVPLPRHRPWLRILLIPFWRSRPDVERIKDVSYGDAGRRNLMDIYRRRDAPANAPVRIYFHGGGFTTGRKSHEARPLLTRLASRGWVCISADAAVFCLAALALAMMPGPNVVFLVTTALTRGSRTAWRSALGVETATLLFAVATAAGLGVVIATSAILFQLLKWVGVAYLVWLGIRSLRHRPGTACVVAAARSRCGVHCRRVALRPVLLPRGWWCQSSGGPPRSGPQRAQTGTGARVLRSRGLGCDGPAAPGLMTECARMDQPTYARSQTDPRIARRRSSIATLGVRSAYRSPLVSWPVSVSWV